MSEKASHGGAGAVTGGDVDHQRKMERTAVNAALSWSGWGSPVGLSILIVAVGWLLICLHWAALIG